MHVRSSARQATLSVALREAQNGANKIEKYDDGTARFALLAPAKECGNSARSSQRANNDEVAKSERQLTSQRPTILCHRRFFRYIYIRFRIIFMRFGHWPAGAFRARDGPNAIVREK